MSRAERIFYTVCGLGLVAMGVKEFVVGNNDALNMTLVATGFLFHALQRDQKIARTRRLVDDIAEALRRGAPPPP